MNLEAYGELEGRVPLCQNVNEWRAYMEFVSAYFTSRGIDNPVVVELGVERGGQKTYYECILGATHIGVDFDDSFCLPDILGDVLNPATKDMLIKELNGRDIDLLFIDLSPKYAPAREAYERYAPLARHIVVFHTVCVPNSGTKQLWEELIAERSPMTKLTIQSPLPKDHPYYITNMGIGILVKADE